MNVSKTFFALLSSLPLAISALAQTTPKTTAATTTAAKTTTPAHKPGAAAATAPALKTENDSLSYAIGLSLANFYKSQGITNINTNIVIKAVNDVKNNKALLNDQQAQSVVVSYMQKLQADKAVGNKKQGQDFLAANGKKPGIVTLPSGLQYQVIQQGTGPKPKATDQVRVHYRGSLINGKVFDSSIENGKPVELSVNGVIPGWTEALQLMPVGSKWKLFVPSDLAYGDRQAGQDIAPGSTLIFDVELLEIINQAAPPPPPAPAPQPDTTKKPQ